MNRRFNIPKHFRRGPEAQSGGPGGRTRDARPGGREWRAGVLLLAAGVVTGAVLVLGAEYPVSAVGVPGETRSNLNPPSLFAVALAVAQIGAFLLVRAGCRTRPHRVRRPTDRHAARRDAPDRGDAGGRTGWLVRAVNRAALPIYLGHQSVLIAVTTGVALFSPAAPGLLTPPSGTGWVLHRLAWLPVFAVLLAAFLVTASAVARATVMPGPGRR